MKTLLAMGMGLVLALGGAFPAAGEDAGDEQARKEVREVMKRLQARYEKTKDLQADFTQKTTIEGFERPMTSSGKVYIKKPGRLRWRSEEHTSELQSQFHLVCRLLLEKKKERANTQATRRPTHST